MRRTLGQVLALLITASFLLTAVSGVVLAFPRQLGGSFGISLLGWLAIHKWSALALGLGVAAHLIRNRARIRGLFAFDRGQSRSRAPSVEAPGQTSLQAIEASPSDSQAGRRLRFTRRRFLVLAGGAVAAGVAALTLDRGGRRPATSAGADRWPNFPILSAELVPTVPTADWQLTVDGLVERPLHLDRTAWLALPRSSETRDFHCIEDWSVENLRWEGVQVGELLSQAGLQPQGQFVTFHAYGGTYSDTLSVAEAQAPDTLLADRLDDQPLPAGHGGPLRLVIPSQLGYKNVKWVVRLEVTAARATGYWESTGYPAEAPVN
jgi:DMSO/TMAO reductase YedYZ molybdopterin-dependent catalytic subunit